MIKVTSIHGTEYWIICSNVVAIEYNPVESITTIMLSNGDDINLPGNQLEEVANSIGMSDIIWHKLNGR